MDLLAQQSHLERPWNQEHFQSPQFYDPEPDDSVANWMQRTYARFKAYRRFYDQPWPRWRNIYIGDHWNGVAPPRWPGEARMVVNFSRFIVHEIVSTVLESEPEMQAVCSHPFHSPYANGLQTYFDSVMNRRNVNAEVKSAFLSACQVGIGYLFPFWDYGLDNGQGDICVRNLPPECCYPQPGANRIDEMGQFIIHRRESRAWMEEFFPDKVDLCHASSMNEMDNYGYGRRQGHGYGGYGGFGGSPYIEGPLSYGYGGDDPQIADKTQFTNPPFKTALGFEERYDVLEMWCKDASIEVKVYEQEVPRIVMDAMGNRFVINEIHREERAEPKYSTGYRHIMTCGRVTLSDEESPYDFIPVVPVYDMETDNEFFGQGTIQTIEPLQYELNKRSSQAINHIVLNGGAVWKIDKNCEVSWESLNNLPAQIIKYRKVTGNEIVREAGVPLPPMFFQAIESAIRNMKTIAGVEMSSVPQKGARSGSAVQSANAIATKQIRMRTKSLEISYKEMGRRFISMIQRNCTEPRWLMVTGSNRFAGHIPFDGRNIRGQWDILVVPGSTLGKETRDQRSIELFDKGAIDDEALLSDLNYPNYQAVIARKRQAIAQESPPYPGFPGLNRDTTEGSGYAASIRSKPATYSLPQQLPPAGSPNIQMPKFPQVAGNPHAVPNK